MEKRASLCISSSRTRKRLFNLFRDFLECFLKLCRHQIRHRRPSVRQRYRRVVRTRLIESIARCHQSLQSLRCWQTSKLVTKITREPFEENFAREREHSFAV